MTVTFDGGGAGSGPLSWGQLDIWVKMSALGQSLAMGGVRPLPAGTGVHDVAAELRYLMSRYESMRTRLVPDGDGPPRQVVHGHGEIDLEIVEAGESDPEEVAGRVEARYRAEPFDHVNDWPVRMAVVRSGDECRFAVLVMSHLVLDGAGAVLMMAETDARTAAPVQGHSALEQARRQSLPAGARQNAAALRHWDTHLRTIPAPRVPPSRDARRPRHWTGVLHSTALPRALVVAATRAGTEAAPALLAAFAVAFARITGVTVVPLRLVSSNRFRAGLADVVCPVSQAGLCVIDTAGASTAGDSAGGASGGGGFTGGGSAGGASAGGASAGGASAGGFTDGASTGGASTGGHFTAGDFTAVVRRTQGAALAAYKHAYYNRLELNAVIAAVVADRGPQFDLDVSLNDRRLGGSLQDVPRRERSEFAWIATQDEPSSSLFLNVDGSDEAMAITMYLDSHFLAPADGEALLWAMESIAVAAAADVAERVPAGAQERAPAGAQQHAAADAQERAAADVQERVAADA
ncbi:condensation domain-containing protein [Dactylosporangium sp. NPDC049525]|uniref:condensation domain-containing protein n=1 Tax=Dactylosporangium sp. NPDC049525 TaxID=3154730 RepID=UPI003412F3E4